jgi:hypothetical protein
MPEIPTVGVKFNTDYLRFGNIQLNDTLLRLCYQFVYVTTLFLPTPFDLTTGFICKDALASQIEEALLC